MSSQVLVYLQPLSAEGEYEDEIDITEDVFLETLSEVREFIDSEDFDIGIFAFGDIELVCDNSRGLYNTPDDPRSRFLFTRNRAKVRVALQDIVITRASGIVTDSTVTEETVFRGLIADESTRQELQNHRVTFRVLSVSSIMDQLKIAVGTVQDGDSVQTALYNIMNQSLLTDLVELNASDINPANNIDIDVGSYFDNLVVGDAVGELLLCSNSVLHVDNSVAIIIGGRDEDAALSTLAFYGPFDLQGRENIMAINEMNSGTHRIFNSVLIGDIEVNDSDYIDEYGVRQKQMAFDFITSEITIAAIGNSIVDEFKEPRQEMEIEVPLSEVLDSELLQKVSVNYPLKAVPPVGYYLPVEGVDEYDADTPYPALYGSLQISPTIIWKIIEKRHDLSRFTTTLKLRQAGSEPDEGYSA